MGTTSGRKTGQPRPGGFTPLFRVGRFWLLGCSWSTRLREVMVGVVFFGKLPIGFHLRYCSDFPGLVDQGTGIGLRAEPGLLARQGCSHDVGKPERRELSATSPGFALRPVFVTLPSILTSPEMPAQFPQTVNIAPFRLDGRGLLFKN